MTILGLESGEVVHQRPNPQQRCRPDDSGACGSRIRFLTARDPFFSAPQIPPVSHPSAPAASAVPTRKRHWVVVFAIALAMICYIDRVIIAQATPTMRADLNLSIEQWGWILGIFSWAYTLCEVPGG